MTKPRRFGLALLAIVTLPTLSARPEATPAAAPKIEDLAFLAGSWATEAGAVRVEEEWLCPSADTMIGMGRTTDVASGKTVFFEYLRIEKRPDGLVYVAQPKGGPATAFRLVRLEAGFAVFENPAHDFPKRVVYSKSPAGGLIARVEGDGRGPENAEEFRYRPAAPRCR